MWSAPKHLSKNDSSKFCIRARIPKTGGGINPNDTFPCRILWFSLQLQKVFRNVGRKEGFAEKVVETKKARSPLQKTGLFKLSASQAPATDYLPINQ